MFDSLLIANRGEIACRIIRTARALGLRTVAVHSDADADALHVRLADEAVRLGPAAAAESYLRHDRVIEAAQATGAQAVHPGYGFLSETPALATGCAEAGITWVGPHSGAIAAMGSKVRAKALAADAGVPVIPGYAGDDQTTGGLAAAARDLGLPVMIKASAGGGGKGMRAVVAESELAAAIDAARAEGERAFGDGRLLIEKLVQHPRHIEVQVLGDKHGTLLHLFERDCSVQRNHQKLLEEAPAPDLSAETRTRLHEAALRLAREIGYDNAGTVEFVMDATTGDFFFLEMNTRLQVEHTVTEEITGLDLVELQLRAAAGERLPLAQADIARTGDALQARLTAEDAANGFRPRTGRILRWVPPAGIRTDSGIATGAEVGASYDSLLAKLTAHGADRDEARRRMVTALERLECVGLTTNRLFLRDAILRPAFAAGGVTTGFIECEWPGGWQPDPGDNLLFAALARHLAPPSGASPWHALGGFRLLAEAGRPARTIYVDAAAPDARVTLSGQGTALTATTDGGTARVEAAWIDERTLRVVREGRGINVGVLFDGAVTHVRGATTEAALHVVPLGDFEAQGPSDVVSRSDDVSAPMPGLVVELRVTPGDAVETGQTVAVFESMKLLTELKATAPGTVAAVGAAPGDTVDAGHVLVTLDPEND
ncbi:ATP-binding protein [Roseovarius salinarum]|uniref:ATP-binding protein n=1 Tax=Roseovarius salinarum TaxID=1981892 RepID=UPI000C32DD32|nr:biotin carboxylase N-terminal domain-containing protein [Roseovarius salinarum]